MNLIETTVTYGDSPAPRRVRVPGRDDTGTVVNPGMNFGSVHCLGIHFRKTGECLYFESSRVTTIKDGTEGL